MPAAVASSNLPKSQRQLTVWCQNLLPIVMCRRLQLKCPPHRQTAQKQIHLYSVQCLVSHCFTYT
jgi:hypothetical protein